MSNALSGSSEEIAGGTTDGVAASVVAPLTPLASALAAPTASLPQALYCGVFTVLSFGNDDEELRSLLHGAGMYDLGWQGRIIVRGEDRVRWLNGMLTNNVATLPEAQGNYNFVLNAQGRIQGDCDAFRLADSFVLHTAASQVPCLMAHLDRYIIMDDVELRDGSADATALGLAGPEAPALLSKLGITVPDSGPAASTSTQGSLAGVPVEVLRMGYGLVPRFALLVPPERVLSVWNALSEAGAAPVGLAATEKLRVLEGTPLYGVDIGDRDLPQETAQARALNFTKGCYLGQEIVERIRSRGNVHRRLGQFVLSRFPEDLPLELQSSGQLAGRVTSAARIGDAVYGLGMARVETVERKQPLEYEGGTATAWEQPSHLPSPALIS